MRNRGFNNSLAVSLVLFASTTLLGQGTPPASKGSSNPAGKSPAANPATKGKSPVGSSSGEKLTRPAAEPAAGKTSPKPRPVKDNDAPRVEPGPNGLAQGIRIQPRQPKWIPLDAENQAFVDEVLDIWEKKSATIDRFRANFVRYTYDQFGPFLKTADGKLGELRPASREHGVVNYKAPSKGMIRVDKVESNALLRTGTKKEDWIEEKVPRDYWMCDGKKVYYLQHADQLLVERGLPPEMQGKFIVNGPLPFVFGAQAANLKQRFWIRPLRPDGPHEAKLEFVPKTVRDAADFAMVQVILEENEKKEVLPKAIRIVDNGGGEQNYVFVDREYNWNETIDKLKNLFEKGFDTPTAPKGYRRTVEPPLSNDDDVPPASNRQAQDNRKTKTK